MCFCPFTLFKQIKLGFDREYFVGRVSDEHAKIYQIALKAQAAALAMPFTTLVHNWAQVSSKSSVAEGSIISPGVIISVYTN